MLKSLNFVRGAVSTKELVPVLTCFHVYGGRIQGTNGRVTIDHPCKDLQGFEFTVPASTFLRAIDNCEKEPKIKVLDGERIEIKSGNFKAVLPLLPHDSFPRKIPVVGNQTPIKEGILPVLKHLKPFISTDASRIWSCGVLFKGDRVYATNNVVLASVKGYVLNEEVNLPSSAIDELLRIGLSPTAMACSPNDATFFFKGGAWLASQIYATNWPEAIDRMLPDPDAVTWQIPADLPAAVQRLAPFVPDVKQPVILLSEEGISTMDGARSASIGGFVLPNGAFRSEPLTAVLGIATHIDFEKYPAACPFKGPDGLSGILIGVKL